MWEKGKTETSQPSDVATCDVEFGTGVRKIVKARDIKLFLSDSDHLYAGKVARREGN